MPDSSLDNNQETSNLFEAICSTVIRYFPFSIRDVFAKIKNISKSDVIKLRYFDELELRKSHLSDLQAQYEKENENLNTLKSEVVKSIKGESFFSSEMLSELIKKSECECERIKDLCDNAQKDVDDTENLLKELSDNFDELLSWAELYNDASFEKKKMIVNYMIKRVEVTKGYELKIDFNFNFEQFMTGIDKAA